MAVEVGAAQGAEDLAPAERAGVGAQAGRLGGQVGLVAAGTVVILVVSVAAGSYSFTVRIASDDPDEDPFTWTVTGTTTDTGSPERVLTVIQSCRMQGRSGLAFLRSAIDAAIRGDPPPSLLPQH